MIEQSLFAGLSWCALIAGLFILIRALLADRARGRRRCPKCWYDLSRTDGRRCPECGHEAAHERALRGTRRRWRWAVVGVLVLIAGHPIARIPTARAHGAAAFAPDWLLVAVLPWYEERLPPAAGQSIYNASYTWPFAELDRRIEAEELGAIGWRLLIERCLAGDALRPLHTEDWGIYSAFLGDAEEHGRLNSKSLRSRASAASPIIWFVSRDAWPTDVPICAELALHSSFRRAIYAYLEPKTPGLEPQELEYYTSNYAGGGCFPPPPDLQSLGIPPADATELRYRVHVRELLSRRGEPRRLGRTLGEFDWAMPVTIHGSLDEYIQIVSVDRFTEIVNRAGVARMEQYGFALICPESAYNVIEEYVKQLPDDEETLTVGYRAEVFCGNGLVASTNAFHYLDAFHFDEYGFPLQFRWPEGARVFRLLQSGWPLRLRLQFEPAAALRDLDAVSGAEGTIEVPIIFASDYTTRETDFQAVDRNITQALAKHLTFELGLFNSLWASIRLTDEDAIDMPVGGYLWSVTADVVADGEIIGHVKRQYFDVSPHAIIARLSIVDGDIEKLVTARERFVRLRPEPEDTDRVRPQLDETEDPPFNVPADFRLSEEIRVPIVIPTAYAKAN